MTTIRREVLTLPAAELGPDNPLPPLKPLDEVHEVEDRDRQGLPRDMARQMGYAPLTGLLPERVRDGYGRRRAPRPVEALVVENDRLRVTVLPALGGRIASLVHKPTGRELLYRNPVFQPACFALNGAWYSGGIEWNIGATGHTALSCSPLHAARVTAPDGGVMLRLWEWERLRDLPFQVDLWLPDGSDFLYVGVRIRNPHERPVPTYWWSNIAVPEERRVLAPADAAWHFGYTRRLRRVDVPAYDGVDRTRPLNSVFPADYFYDVPQGRRGWIAALDDAGRGLVQTSTDTLRGRKLFVWGSGPGGRRWQEWLTEPGTGGYCEIQAGLARTQLEHVKLEAESEVSWLEAYGPLDVDPAAAHGDDWARALASAEERLEAVLPRADVEAAHAAWAPAADTEPGERLATGSGWGALEVLRGGFTLPGTPFGPETLGEEQRPWLELLRTGTLPEEDPQAGPPCTTPVAPHWRDMLETAAATATAEYHLGLAQWHAGDRAQAVRSWERGLKAAPGHWALLRCTAFADQEEDHPERAADRYEEAFAALCRAATGGDPDAPPAPRGPDTPEEPHATRASVAPRGPEAPDGWEPALAALGRETAEALLGVGRTARAREVWERLPRSTRERGRFRLLEVEILLAEGRRDAARAVFDEGFEVADLREGSETLSRLWAACTDEPLPARYDFRMRPPE